MKERKDKKKLCISEPFSVQQKVQCSPPVQPLLLPLLLLLLTFYENISLKPSTGGGRNIFFKRLYLKTNVEVLDLFPGTCIPSKWQEEIDRAGAQIGRQVGRQMGRQVDGQVGGQVDGQVGGYRSVDRQVVMQVYRYIGGRWVDMQGARQLGWQVVEKCIVYNVHWKGGEVYKK